MGDEDFDSSSSNNSTMEKITSVSICEDAKSKIERSRQIRERFCCGYLTGRTCDTKINVYDLIELDLTLFKDFDITTGQSDEVQAEFAAIRASFPVGIDIVGLFITQPENGNIEVAEHLIRILQQIEDISMYSDLQYAVCLIKPSSCLWHIHYPDEHLQSVAEPTECVDDHLSRELLFRIRKVVDVNCLVRGSEESILGDLDIIGSISCKSAFLIDDIRTILYDKDDGQILPALTGTDIINELKVVHELKTWPQNKPMGNVVNVSTLIRMSSEVLDNENDATVNEDCDIESTCSVPVLLSKRVSGECVTVKVNVDALVLVPTSTPTQKLLYMFREAVYRQCNALSLILRNSKTNRFYKPFHFKPLSTLLFPITVFIPCVDIKGNSIKEDSTIDYRKSLHQRFLLPEDRPLFLQALSPFSDRKFSNFHLINPHEGLNTPDIEGSKLAMVQGKYSYHHYMQDDFDDNIWGCAYRSLQTLASWFWFQGYNDKKYPLHKEIQEALVAMGDKEKSFIGSKEWIGSLEVSYCLDHIYGVTSKTLHVSTGADMAYKGRDLYQHFIEQGTPIMIGGGVLAHSIVGVVYNELTGAVRFLIVDPHFTGNDVLKTVQSKGWVTWKGPEYWNQTAHYNMCMPQRPKAI